jgi:outer membrane protein TolC
MQKIKLFIILFLFTSLLANAQQNTLSLSQVLDSIKIKNPLVKMYEAEIKSMDEAAKGAKSWMAPEIGTGFFMTPYNPMYWKPDSKMGTQGMGQYMISAQQMFPNKKRLDAESAYMKSMSSTEQQNKNYALNLLFAEAKNNYYNILIAEKKLSIINENEKLLNFMIQSAELRYKNNMEKIGAYYKTKAALGNVQSMKIMLLSEITKSKIALNTLLNRNKQTVFSIDTTYALKDISNFTLDSTIFLSNRSDLKAIDKQIEINQLKQNLTNASLKPEFGIKYDHMFTFGNQPQLYSLMGMMKIPIAPWSSKMYKSQSISLKYKDEALKSEKQMILNETIGMASSMKVDYDAMLQNIKLYQKHIIPALQNNYKTFLIGYEQNTEELFMLFDAWESLNMSQMNYLDKLNEALKMQTELEKLLEIN